MVGVVGMFSCVARGCGFGVGHGGCVVFVFSLVFLWYLGFYFVYGCFVFCGFC